MYYNIEWCALGRFKVGPSKPQRHQVVPVRLPIDQSEIIKDAGQNLRTRYVKRKLHT